MSVNSTKMAPGRRLHGGTPDAGADKRHHVGAPSARLTGLFHASALGLLALMLFTLAPASALAQLAPVNLGKAGNFTILSETGITDVPPSPITGNIGTSPITGAAIGVSCTEVTAGGKIYSVDAAGPPCETIDPTMLGQAVLDMQTAYTDAAGRTLPDFVEFAAGDISGKTLLPGLYKWSTGVSVDNTGVTLSGGPNAVWIFQISGDLLLANTAHVTLAGGARAVNVFWQIAGPTGATLGTGASISGSILSAKQVILNTGATLNGRALAQTQVTLQSTSVNDPGTLVNGIPVLFAPTVTSTVPVNLSTNVAIGSMLSATFSEAMNAAKINGTTFTLRNGLTPIAGVVSYLGVTAAFAPSAALPANTTLTASITTGAQDPQGVGLAANYVWTFVTGAVPDTTPPTVSSTIPATGATGVPIASALAATFSEAMDPTTITTANFKLAQGANPVAGVVTYAGVTGTFTPTAALSGNTLYTATITTGVKDLAGNDLAVNYTWTFTTGTAPDTTPPTVSSTAPVPGAVNVPPGSSLAVTFSEAMNPLTINNTTITLKQGSAAVSGVVTYAGVTATFTPLVPLTQNLPYTATVTTGVADLAGNALVTAYGWTFTTGSTPDTTPPTVSSTAPAAGATNVPIASSLAATFSEAMDPTTITTANFKLAQGANPVTGVVTYAGVTGTFTPTAGLSGNTVYTATITTGVKDLAGNALAAPYTWTFTTGTIPDTTPPTVSSTVPGSGAGNVPTASSLAVTFSEAMNPLTINTSTLLLKHGNVAVSGVVTYAGVTATFTPTAALTQNVLYTATVTTGVTDLAGNALVTAHVWTFTTGATSDTTPPIVISTAPTAGASSVPITSALAVTFSEAMNPLTISNTTITLQQGNTQVPGAVTYAGVTAVFTPTGVLAGNAVYTATIGTGVTDLAGNSLVTPYVWSFTTSSTPDTTPPTVSSTAPGSNASNVSASSGVSVTFSEVMNPLTVNNTTLIVRQGGNQIAGSVRYAGLTGTFTPTNPLPSNSFFTATVTTGVTDLAGNALLMNFVWSFSTATGTPPDITRPTVISTVPSNGSANVPLGSTLAATFSEAMNPQTVNTSTFTLKQGNASVAGSVTYGGFTGTFTPSITLAPNTTFTASISTAATDLAGNALASAYSWSFTTGSTPDTTAPTIISTFPISGAALVTTTANVIANFSELMNPSTVSTATFTLQQGTTPVIGTVAYSNTSATFTPAMALSANTKYTATVTTGVTDLAGNSLMTTYTWTFTTGSSTGQSPICIPNFAVMAGQGIISSGATAVTGDVGVSPGTVVSGFPPGTLSGAIHLNDAMVMAAMVDFTSAYHDAVTRAVGPVTVAGDLGGQTFTAGLYNSLSSLVISAGNLTLDAKGDVNAVFIFQMASTLTTSANSKIILAGGAQPANIFWQVGSSATLGANSVFNGNILASQDITLGQGATLNGRLAASTGTIDLQANNITSPSPSIVHGGILNAATESRTVAPGSIAVVFGTDLGSSLAVSKVIPLPTSLDGTSLQFGTQSAPLFMTSCGQINVQVPWELAGQISSSVTATVEGLTSTQEPATIAPYAPGIFSLNMIGTGQGVVEIAPTAQLAMPTGPLGRPVKRGEYIAIFATGLGPVSNQPATGAATASNLLSVTPTTPIVQIGGVAGQVTYSGLAPDFTGLYQINVIVPATSPVGDSVSLSLSIGGVQSNTVTIAVQ